MIDDALFGPLALLFTFTTNRSFRQRNDELPNWVKDIEALHLQLNVHLCQLLPCNVLRIANGYNFNPQEPANANMYK